MKEVLRSIKPYWLYLILIGKKTIEVGKSFPKADDWSRDVVLYCSKDLRSFNRIPEKDREWMRKYLGKCACRFVCDKDDEYRYGVYDGEFCYHIPTIEGEKTCLEYNDVEEYGGGKPLYFWRISDLKIYDKPRELSEFCIPEWFRDCEKGCPDMERMRCPVKDSRKADKICCWCRKGGNPITRPPQSWAYCEVRE